MRATAEERFLHYSGKSDVGCWEWVGALDSHGYGQLGVGGRTRLASRFGYEMMVGPIPEGLSLDHLCSNPICVNPAHLEPVTHLENMRRGKGVGRGVNAPNLGTRAKARRTHCKHGHEFTPENTRIQIDSRGFSHRRCRTCYRTVYR